MRQPASKCHDGKRELSSICPEKGKTLSIVFVSIDLAKNVCSVHDVNDAGKPELVRPNVPRAKLHALIANLPPRTIGMEACSGAYHWARLFQVHGHTVRLMAPKFVAPYRLSGKQGKTMRQTPPPSARPCGTRPCASCRSSPSNSRAS